MSSLLSCHDDYKVNYSKDNCIREGSILGKGSAILAHKDYQTQILKEYSHPNLIVG